MRKVDWPSGEIEMIPEAGEHYEFWDFGVHHKIEKFTVSSNYWRGTGRLDWQSELHTNRGVLLTGISEDRGVIVEQMMRDVEHYRQ